MSFSRFHSVAQHQSPCKKQLATLQRLKRGLTVGCSASNFLIAAEYCVYEASKKSLAKAREDLKDTKENQRHTSTLNDHLQPALDSLNIIRRGVSDLRPKLEVFNSIYDLFKAHVTKHIMFLADKVSSRFNADILADYATKKKEFEK